MSTISRRSIIRDGLMTAGANLLGASALSRIAAEILAGTAQSLNSSTPTNNRMLVVIQLAGGNDGLSTVIPYTDPLYAQNRPTLAVPANQVIPLTSTLGLNPLLSALKPLWDARQMAVVENVGYPNSNLSHFQSMYIWQTLDMTGSQGSVDSGWLGNYLARVGTSSSTPFVGLEHGVDLAPALASPSISIPTIGSATTFMVMGNKSEPVEVDARTQHMLDYYQSFAHESASNPFGAYFANVSATSVSATKQFAAANEAYKPAATYPQSSLSQGLQMIASAITQNLGIRVGWVTLGGFDTHGNEANTLKTLYPDLAQSIAAFWQDLTAQNAADDVVMMTWSEFGRRVQENGSAGTDHGTSAPLFVFGPSVSGGIHGDAPDLSHLDSNGNLSFQADFRSVYATMLENWMQVDATQVLGGNFPTLDFLG